MGIRDRLKQVGKTAMSKGIDLVAKQLYGRSTQGWSEEERAAGVILSGSSRTATVEAERLAREVGYDVKTSADPSLDITRPRAGRTFGARFDHYPILAPEIPLPPKGSEAAWDITEIIRPHLIQGLAEYKERVVLALSAVQSPASELLEDQLLELHPILEPQCVVLFLRLGNEGEERLFRRLKLGSVTLTLPHIPLVMVFHLAGDGTLTYKSLAHGKLDTRESRFGILSLLEGISFVEEGTEAVLEIQEGKGRYRSQARDGYPRPFRARIPLGSENVTAGEAKTDSDPQA